MLADMRAFLSTEIKEACKKYQAKRDEDNKKEVKEDTYTQKVIAESSLTTAERKLALKVAQTLGGAYESGVNDEGYKTTLPSIVSAIGHGSILTTIAKIADEDHPHLARLVVEITRLPNMGTPT
jgi:hypothetical protein